MRFLSCLLLALLASAPAFGRSLQARDFAALHDVSNPAISPDGQWVAYSVRTIDLDKDKRYTNLWLTRWDGSSNRALTFGSKSQSLPRFSPDSRQLAFLSGRGDEDKGDQLWIMDLSGGEARQVTTLKGEVADYAWSPDGKHLVLVVTDPDPADDEKDKDKAKPPIVITRYYFKQDIVGYLTQRRSHLFLLDLAGGEPRQLTSGDHDELLPAFSPDGSEIAYATKRGADPDRSDDWDIYVIGSASGATERQLTHSPEADGNPDWESYPAWSPDGKRIAYLHGGPVKKIEYATDCLAIIPAAGGDPKLLTASLDRNVYQPHWTADGRGILVRLEEDRHTVVARVDAASGALKPLTPMEGTVDQYASDAGHVALLWSSPSTPFEVYAWDGGQRRPLSRQNDAFLKGLELAREEDFSARSADGTEVHGFLTYPVGYVKGQRYPTLSFNHGGPQSQSEARFDFNHQLFAANGYAVVATNYRGSTGRGTDYAMGIYASWGGKDVEDVHAAVDEMVKRGIADPDHLGVGGWSYGGMLTNYLIASDTRFKAAVSGASISNILAGFGTDQYIRDYENELGLPWQDLDTWMKVSYPFYHADRIKTPTLFMGGARDFNVTLLNQEQMYQALQALEVPTGLVIYPDQFHGFTRPSYMLDRYQRWLDWYAKWLKPGAAAPSAAGAAAGSS
jgi:dipeptidyl aminopeptidase/acylaminoacyl peptidase